MNFIPLAACIFLIFCPPRHHHRHVQTWSNGMPTCDAIHTTNCNVGPRAPTPYTGCRDVVSHFHDSWGNQDDYVGSYRAKDQHSVLVCLDAYAKKQGLQ